jgi:hypothetical protein
LIQLDNIDQPGLAWPGLAWPGLAWPGLAWLIKKAIISSPREAPSDVIANTCHSCHETPLIWNLVLFYRL